MPYALLTFLLLFTSACANAPDQMQATQATHTPEYTAVVIPIPTMENVPLLMGYNAYGIRVLEQPAAVVRECITLTVEQVIVFPDHIAR